MLRDIIKYEDMTVPSSIIRYRRDTLACGHVVIRHSDLGVPKQRNCSICDHLSHGGVIQYDGQIESWDHESRMPRREDPETVKNQAVIRLREDDLTNTDDMGFKWSCPDCRQMLIWAPYAWWDIKCRCRVWSLIMFAQGARTIRSVSGEKIEDDEED